MINHCSRYQLPSHAAVRPAPSCEIPQLSNIEHWMGNCCQNLPDFPGKCGMWQPSNFAKHPLVPLDSGVPSEFSSQDVQLGSPALPLFASSQGSSPGPGNCSTQRCTKGCRSGSKAGDTLKRATAPGADRNPKWILGIPHDFTKNQEFTSQWIFKAQSNYNF